MADTRKSTEVVVYRIRYNGERYFRAADVVRALEDADEFYPDNATKRSVLRNLKTFFIELL